MPAKSIKVNLIGESDLEYTPWGRIISWATTYGRYTMILTEIVVLLAFMSRFSLDRKLTDLNEEISQKQTIIEANLTLEKEIRAAGDKLTKTKEMLASQAQAGEVLEMIISFLPADVYFISLDINADRINAKVTAGTNQGFSQFLAALNGNAEVANVDIADLKKDPIGGISFQMNAQLAKAKAKK